MAGEIWKKMPESEKITWKEKATRLADEARSEKNEQAIRQRKNRE